jgi:hypothetical protein
MVADIDEVRPGETAELIRCAAGGTSASPVDVGARAWRWGDRQRRLGDDLQRDIGDVAYTPSRHGVVGLAAVAGVRAQASHALGRAGAPVVFRVVSALERLGGDEVDLGQVGAHGPGGREVVG